MEWLPGRLRGEDNAEEKWRRFITTLHAPPPAAFRDAEHRAHAIRSYRENRS